MTPLNHLINFSSELTQRPSFFAKNVASRFVTVVSIPLELLAVLENTIKLPFQTAAAIVKIPAKIVNVVVDSMSLKEFESSLASPLDAITTAIKIAGFAIGLLFTATLGLISPHKNFRLHCSLSLVDDHHAQKLIRLAKENKQKEIDSHEKIIEERLKGILDAMRQQAQLIEFLTPEQRQEIEALTGMSCPSLEDLFQETPTVDDKEETVETPDVKIEEEKNEVINTPEMPAIAEEEIIPEIAVPEEKITDLIPEQNESVEPPAIDLDSALSSPIPEASEEPQEIHTDEADDSSTIIPFEEELEAEAENTQPLENQEPTPEEGIGLVNAG